VWINACTTWPTHAKEIYHRDAEAKDYTLRTLRLCGEMSTHMQKVICVYSSSSDAIAPAYFEAATELGRHLAIDDYTLVYGGGCLGLMGAVARAVHAHGGRVIGIIPGYLQAKGIAYASCDELLITADLRERKAMMDARSDAFIALPGGFGTLEETLEVLTLKQLQVHSKPIVLMNTCGFYDPLINLFEHIFDQQFAKPQCRELYYLALGAASAVDYIRNYQPPVLESKWFRKSDAA
jgi:cytokinin riboside 5'-monophosphate phosphoribohydrolase